MEDRLAACARNTLFYLLVLGVFVLLRPPVASAHQPVLLRSDPSVTVESPEVSKAYYGELPSSPATYTIWSPKPFRLYVGVLAPDLPGVRKDLSVRVWRYKSPVASLDASSARWQRFYEPFGGDWYFQGPELRKTLGRGLYCVVVSRPGNRGKYTLAIGDREEFPPLEILRTLFLLPTLKTEFFGKPWWTAYFNLIGLFAALALALVLTLFGLSWLLVRRRRRARYGRSAAA